MKIFLLSAHGGFPFREKFQSESKSILNHLKCNGRFENTLPSVVVRNEFIETIK